MFKRDVKTIREILLRNLRQQGLETPLLQKRLMDAWPDVAGEVIAGYTTNVRIYKDGEEKSGVQFKFVMEFPNKKFTGKKK